MRIYALELDNDIKGKEERRAHIDALMAELEAPDLVVLPELALPSYMGSDAIWAHADTDSRETAAWAMETARKWNTAIAVGYVEAKAGEIYNAYLIADGDKVHGIVRKSEGESYLFKRGDFDAIIHTPFGPVAVAICYDARRKGFYDKIREEAVALILFPHGSPSDPRKMAAEAAVNDAFCGAYAEAFDVPVIYVNSKGRMDPMPGWTGRMMMQAGFRLNGLSKIHSTQGKPLPSPRKEVLGLEVALTPKHRVRDIRFHGNDITPGNRLFRRVLLPWDVRAGIRFYQREKHRIGKGRSSP